MQTYGIFLREFKLFNFNRKTDFQLQPKEQLFLTVESRVPVDLEFTTSEELIS